MEIKKLLQRSLVSLMLIPSFSYAARDTFVYCSEGSPSTFNPQTYTDGTSNNASGHTIYDRLVHFEYGGTKVIPGLAHKWDISKDKKTFTFYLRKGVKFHKTKYFTPSRDFNADDVLFSFNRQRLKDHPFHNVGGANYDYWNGMEMTKIIKDIKKVDNFTLKITLTRPEAPFLANLAMSFASILSKEYGDQLAKAKEKEKIDFYPIGTGPFVFKKYKKDTLIRYTTFKNFWGKRPKFSKLVFAITPDASVRYQKLKSGECNLIIEPSPSDIADMKKNPKIKVSKRPSLNVGYLAMNVEKKPFNNVKVRQAINHALNKESYIKAIYLNNAVVAKNPLPPLQWSYDEKIADYDFNIAKAKNLLKDAGYPNGFETELWTLPVTRPYNPNGKKMGEMMQADLAKIGIKARLVTYDWPTYLEKSRKGEHQLIQLGWSSDNADPDNFLNVLLGCSGVKGGSNVARWCFDKFEKLIQKAKVVPTRKKRELLYKQAQKVFKQRAPWVPIAHSVIYRAMSANVKNYKIDPLGGDIFRYVEF